MIRVLAVAASVALLWAGAALAQDTAKPDPAKGQKIVNQVCAACHGPHGNSVAPANPKLAGQFSAYLYKQLRNFKSQDGKKPERESPIMAGMVANLSDADMRDVAAYFSGQKLKPDVARDKDLAAVGQKLYRGGNAATGVVACAGCHGPSGAGIPIEFPHIAGQYAEYVEGQLKAFRSGTRANDPNGMMRGVTARMTDEEIKAVSQYVAGLR
jgi:cytochrome c553